LERRGVAVRTVGWGLVGFLLLKRKTGALRKQNGEVSVGPPLKPLPLVILHEWLLQGLPLIPIMPVGSLNSSWLQLKVKFLITRSKTHRNCINLQWILE
jgi:hypothetical protein